MTLSDLWVFFFSPRLMSVLICDSQVPLWDSPDFILDLLIFFPPLLLPFAPYTLYGGECVNCSCALRRGVLCSRDGWAAACCAGLGGREGGREADGRARWKWLRIITATSSRLIKQTNTSGVWVAIRFILVFIFSLQATAVKRKSSPKSKKKIQQFFFAAY